MAVSEIPTLLAASGPDSGGQLENDGWRLPLRARLRTDSTPAIFRIAIAAMADVALYHGVRRLLADRPEGLCDWPGQWWRG